MRPIRTERFATFRSDGSAEGVRQIMGRTGEVWAAESANDRPLRLPDPRIAAIVTTG